MLLVCSLVARPSMYAGACWKHVLHSTPQEAELLFLHGLQICRLHLFPCSAFCMIAACMAWKLVKC